MEIKKTLEMIFEPFKGILAADERPVSIKKKLESAGIEGSEQMIDQYRNMLFSTPSIENTISGVILAHDTFMNHKTESVLTREYLNQKGIVVGVKVDEGLSQYKDTNLSLTKGLENLEEVCKDVKNKGASFLKWRTTIPVGSLSDEYKTDLSNQLAQYAKVSIENNLVPIIEPEVLLAGNHTLEESATTLKEVLTAVIDGLYKNNVSPNNCILKTSFATQGIEKGYLNSKEVAETTLQVFKDVGLNDQKHFYGIVFLSGGLPSDVAIEYIQVIKNLAEDNFTTPITFSYGRALQEPALSEWKGDESNILNAQLKFTETLQKAVKIRKGDEILPGASAGK